MLARGAAVISLVVAVWACLSVPAHGQRFPPFLGAFNPRPPTASEVELQRVGTSLAAPLDKQPSARTGDYSDAVYAAYLARELDRLEDDNNSIYVDFISAAYMNPQIPRGFPTALQRLSRGAPTPFAPPRVAVPSSSAAFGPVPPLPFAGLGQPGVGRLFPFARRAVRR